LSSTSPLLSPAAGRSLWGIACAIAACLGFAALDTTSQLIGMAAPLVMVQWVRYLTQTATSVAVIVQLGELKKMRISKPSLHITRGLMMLTTTALGFTSLRYVPVADFTAIIMLTPLLVTLLSTKLLGEQVSLLRWALAAGGFAGVLVIIRPGSHAFEPAYSLVLLLVLVGAAFQLLTAYMMRTENSAQTHLSSGVVGVIITTALLPFFWQALPPRIWALSLLMGLAASFGHLMLLLALRRANASVISPYLYTQLAFAVIAGWLVFGRVPDAWSYIGMALIAACGIANALLTRREHQQAASLSAAEQHTPS
jgi:drug/metabolite transporter (DMT)-like permease